MSKFEYRVYDCNSQTCYLVGIYTSLDSAKDAVFFLGSKFGTRKYYVIEVYNSISLQVTKVHYSSTSLYYNPSIHPDFHFHQICLDYGKCEKYNSYLELKKNERNEK